MANDLLVSESIKDSIDLNDSVDWNVATNVLIASVLVSVSDASVRPDDEQGTIKSLQYVLVGALRGLKFSGREHRIFPEKKTRCSLRQVVELELECSLNKDVISIVRALNSVNQQVCIDSAQVERGDEMDDEISVLGKRTEIVDFGVLDINAEAGTCIVLLKAQLHT